MENILQVCPFQADIQGFQTSFLYSASSGQKNLIRGIKVTLGGSMGLLEKDVNIMCGKTGDKRSVADR